MRRRSRHSRRPVDEDPAQSSARARKRGQFSFRKFRGQRQVGEHLAQRLEREQRTLVLGETLVERQHSLAWQGLVEWREELLESPLIRPAERSTATDEGAALQPGKAAQD